MQENKLLAAGAVYGMDVVAQTFKSINAFEVTYNGVVLHSKLKTGAFPDPTAIALKLKEVMAKTDGASDSEHHAPPEGSVPRDEL